MDTTAGSLVFGGGVVAARGGVMVVVGVMSCDSAAAAGSWRGAVVLAEPVESFHRVDPSEPEFMPEVWSFDIDTRDGSSAGLLAEQA